MSNDFISISMIIHLQQFVPMNFEINLERFLSFEINDERFFIALIITAILISIVALFTHFLCQNLLTLLNLLQSHALHPTKPASGDNYYKDG